MIVLVLLISINGANLRRPLVVDRQELKWGGWWRLSEEESIIYSATASRLILSGMNMDLIHYLMATQTLTNTPWRSLLGFQCLQNISQGGLGWVVFLWLSGIVLCCGTLERKVKVSYLMLSASAQAVAVQEAWVCVPERSSWFLVRSRTWASRWGSKMVSGAVLGVPPLVVE